MEPIVAPPWCPRAVTRPSLHRLQSSWALSVPFWEPRRAFGDRLGIGKGRICHRDGVIVTLPRWHLTLTLLGFDRHRTRLKFEGTPFNYSTELDGYCCNHRTGSGSVCRYYYAHRHPLFVFPELELDSGLGRQTTLWNLRVSNCIEELVH